MTLKYRLRSHHGNMFDPPRNSFWSYRVTSSAPMADGLTVAGPSLWNSLLDSLRDPVICGNSFRQSLKTFLFATYWCIHRIRRIATMRYINRLFTYLLTHRSHEVIKTDVIQKLGYGFLFTFYSNYGRIFSRFWDIQHQRMAWLWKLGEALFKVIENCTVQ